MRPADVIHEQGTDTAWLLLLTALHVGVQASLFLLRTIR